MGSRTTLLAGVFIGLALGALMVACAAATARDTSVHSLAISPGPGNKVKFVVTDAQGKEQSYLIENQKGDLLIDMQGISLRGDYLSVDFRMPAPTRPAKSRWASFWDSFVGKPTLASHL